MWNALLDESQAGIKIAGRNSNNLRYSRWYHSNGRKQTGAEEPLDEVKEESEKAGLKFNIQKMKIMASGRITLWQIDGETAETVTDYILGLQNHWRRWLQPWN